MPDNAKTISSCYLDGVRNLQLGALGLNDIKYREEEKYLNRRNNKSLNN